MSSTSTPLSHLLKHLEETNDPAVAYFSFDADENGERGIIHANKEGLRLYALELLKKSVQMEAVQDGKNICFQPAEWLVSESGYNLIGSVKPEYKDRGIILNEQPTAYQPVLDKITPDQTRTKGCLGLLLVWLVGLGTLGAAIKCFS